MQQMQAMSSLQAERDAHAKDLEKRKLQRPRQQQQSLGQIPPVPAVPAIPPVPPLPPK